jgi:hypothetical protein
MMAAASKYVIPPCPASFPIRGELGQAAHFVEEARHAPTLAHAQTCLDLAERFIHAARAAIERQSSAR